MEPKKYTHEEIDQIRHQNGDALRKACPEMTYIGTELNDNQDSYILTVGFASKEAKRSFYNEYIRAPSPTNELAMALMGIPVRMEVEPPAILKTPSGHRQPRSNQAITAG